MAVRFTRQAEFDLEEIAVLIVRVLHGSRDLLALFSEQDL